MANNHGGPRTNSGGSRPKAGRPRLVPDQDTCIEELVFPAICSAWRASPQDGRYCANFTIHLSKSAIRRAYGEDGLRTFLSFFKEVKRGGVTLDGTPYYTRWEVPYGVYKTVKTLVEKLGHSLTDLPDPGFPPPALSRRLQEAEDRAEARRQKKAQG